MAITAAFWSRRSECGIDRPLSGAAAACYGALMKISGRAEYKPVGDSLACHCNFNRRCGCEHSPCSCFFNVESLKATFLSLFGNGFLVLYWSSRRSPSFWAVGTECLWNICRVFLLVYPRKEVKCCANRKATALLCNSETKTVGSGRGSGLRRRKRILTDALVYIKSECWKTSTFFVFCFLFPTEIGLFQSSSRNSGQAACSCYKCRKENQGKITLSECFETRKWTLFAKKRRSIGYTWSWRTDICEEISIKGWKEASKCLKSPR